MSIRAMGTGLRSKDVPTGPARPTWWPSHIEVDCAERGAFLKPGGLPRSLDVAAACSRAYDDRACHAPMIKRPEEAGDN